LGLAANQALSGAVAMAALLLLRPAQTSRGRTCSAMERDQASDSDDGSLTVRAHSGHVGCLKEMPGIGASRQPEEHSQCPSCSRPADRSATAAFAWRSRSGSLPHSRDSKRQDPTGPMASRLWPRPDKRSPRKRSSGYRQHSATPRLRVRPGGVVAVSHDRTVLCHERTRPVSPTQTIAFAWTRVPACRQPRY
jgi:hypothetical protein